MMTRTKKKKNRKRKPRMPKVCPAHSVKLVAKVTRYGTRWSCPTEGCTVRYWGGATSTPCDQQTADERQATHEAFDPLWREHAEFESRGAAYRWLQERMGLGTKECHIGMFSSAQCQEARRHLAAMEVADAR